ncbi:MAG: hypothetical protein K0R54_8 [Clostridiaceae bacterium]|jgi:transposase-like protein|nr:hypothetical protein [Clostridiaceae bacterium]
MISQFLLQAYTKYIAYKTAKRSQLIHCNDCNKEGVPKKEMSVLNLLIFLILGIVIGFAYKALAGFLGFLGMVLINSLILKPKCPNCRSYNISKIDFSKNEQPESN